MQIKKNKPWRNKKYVEYIRNQPCVITQHQAPSDPHHITGVKQGGMGTKVGDEFLIPLCHTMHQILHNDPQGFEEKFGTQLFHLDRIQKQAVEDGMLDPFMRWRTGL